MAYRNRYDGKTVEYPNLAILNFYNEAGTKPSSKMETAHEMLE